MQLLELRKSIRSYRDCPVAPEAIKRLKAVATMITTHEPGLYFSVLENDSTPFDSFSRFYGSFKNVRNYICCVVDNSFPDSVEKAGYYGMELVLEALRLGLGTCFVSGTFSKSKVDVFLRAGQNILFLIAFGYPEDKSERPLGKLSSTIMHLKNYVPEDFYISGPGKLDYRQAIEKYPELISGLKGLSLSPSALNKRPVRVYVDKEGQIRACLKQDDSKMLIDLGIAKFIFQIFYNGSWEWGNDALFFPE